MNPVARQVITVSPTGAVAGLQRKRGQGLDLTTFGRAHVVRVSEVLWDDASQRWYVRLLCAPYDSVRLTEALWTHVTTTTPPGASEAGLHDWAMLFGSYEDAVSAEIQFLDAARLRGLLPTP